MEDDTSQASEEGDEAPSCEVGGKSVASDLEQLQLM